MNKQFSKFKHLPFYLLIMMTMGLSAIFKIIGFEVPEWFSKQFSGSMIDIFPGAISLSWIFIAILEFTAFALILLAIVKGEFRDDVSKKWTQPAFFITEITFIILVFGQDITHQYEAAFSLFAYAVLTYLAARVVLSDNDKLLQTT
jgi:hypothetical protein